MTHKGLIILPFAQSVIENLVIYASKGMKVEAAYGQTIYLPDSETGCSICISLEDNSVLRLCYKPPTKSWKCYQMTGKWERHITECPKLPPTQPHCEDHQPDPSTSDS